MCSSLSACLPPHRCLWAPGPLAPSLHPQKLAHPLYVVHWVWGGSTMESKRQNMRDAIKFHDPPEYYTSPDLVTFDLDLLPVRTGSW